MQVAGDAAMVQRQGGLDQPGDPGPGLQVADVRLHRADGAGPIGGTALGEDPTERPGLDRVAHQGAGAMGLDVPDG